MSEIAFPARSPSRVVEAVTMSTRCVRMSRRQLDSIIMSLMLPVALMLMFVYLFGGAILPGGKYVSYVVPGVLVLCAGYGAAMTAVSVCLDMTGGIIDRFRSMDIAGSSLLSGHVVASISRNLVATAAVFGVAFAIGFRPHASVGAWMASIGILLAWLLAISWMAAAIGLVVKSPEAAQGFTFFLMFLPYPSSAIVPIRTMPGWIQGFARNQPITPVVDSLHNLLLGQPVGNAPWVALAWCAGICVVSIAGATALFRRQTT